MSAHSQHTSIKIEPTPWDTTALGIRTFELGLPDAEPDQESTITRSLIDITDAEEKTLYYCRISAGSPIHKRILTRAGFYNCETQLHMYRGGMGNFSAPKELGSKRLSIASATERDYIDVASEALNVFKYSRFHEDPFIDSATADNRMRVWCSDMQKQGVPLLVSRGKTGKLDAFLFYRHTANKHVELILGGSLPGKGMLSPLFWASFLEYFKAIEIKSISTKISASNLVIANIYLLFGFSVKTVHFDYHKLVDPHDSI